MSLLIVENVAKRFGGLVAVDDVSFEIGQGDLIAIVGPNGAGKTTLFNVVNGVYPADQGRILFEDVDVTRFPAFRRAHLGMGRTFQIPRPFASATVRENIAIGAMFGAEGSETGVERSMEMADHYIELIGLGENRDKPAARPPIHNIGLYPPGDNYPDTGGRLRRELTRLDVSHRLIESDSE